ncbi:MAG: tRNA pseudouridine(55) synthase TruB [Burkholderiales bacterium]|nr:tRNA pseudouridine(55) synthase TruB [Burkholderiales bacterium]
MRLLASPWAKTEGLLETNKASHRTPNESPNGVLLLDKPSGLTSNAALQKIRRLYSRAKAGHTGTLDPLASGLLAVCFGEATKFSNPLLEARKSYLATMRLGWRSTTGDAEGELTKIAPPDFDRRALRRAISDLSGPIEQVPPMYSAVKIKGQPLYSLARKGVSVERVARQVHIYQLDMVRRFDESLEIAVTCSKGTYIRVLAEDLGNLLGCGAYLTALRRVAIGTLNISDAIGLDALASLGLAERLELLKPMDLLLADLPDLRLSDVNSSKVCQGLTVSGYHAIAPLHRVRIYTEGGGFLGLGEIDEHGVLKPKRLVSTRHFNRP